MSEILRQQSEFKQRAEWEDLVAISGIEKEHEREIQSLLKEAKSRHEFIAQLGHYLDTLSGGKIGKFDSAEKKRLYHTGEAHTVTLSESERTLYNLFEQMRGDQESVQNVEAPEDVIAAAGNLDQVIKRTKSLGEIPSQSGNHFSADELELLIKDLRDGRNGVTIEGITRTYGIRQKVAELLGIPLSEDGTEIKK